VPKVRHGQGAVENLLQSYRRVRGEFDNRSAFRDRFEDNRYKAEAICLRSQGQGQRQWSLRSRSRPTPTPVTMKIHGQGNNSFSSMPIKAEVNTVSVS